MASLAPQPPSWASEARALWQGFWRLHRSGLERAGAWPRPLYAWPLFTLILLAVLVDGATTYALLQRDGFYEANPFAAGAMELVGVTPLLLAVTTACLVLPGLAVALPRTAAQRSAVALALFLGAGKIYVATANTLLALSG